MSEHDEAPEEQESPSSDDSGNRDREIKDPLAQRGGGSKQKAWEPRKE